MTIGARIRELRENAGLAQKDLAKALHMANSTLSQYESGNRFPSDDVKAKLADYFNVTVDFLLGRGPAARTDDVTSIPVLGSIPAGIPLEAIEDIIDWEDIPASMCSGGKEYFGLRVIGDSMYPEYLEGDTVIIRKTPCCDSGDVCVVYVNGYDATLKQVKLADSGEITIIPRNPTYPPRTYTKQEVEDLPVSIAGVVVELRRKIGKGGRA